MVTIATVVMSDSSIKTIKTTMAASLKFGNSQLVRVATLGWWVTSDRPSLLDSSDQHQI